MPVKFKKVPVNQRTTRIFKVKPRNMERIQYESIRKKVDQKFNEAHDLLTEIYYQEWKIGNYTNDFHGYKPLPNATPEEAKQLFDKLHGLIFHLHTLALDAQNETDGRLYPKLREDLDRFPEDGRKSRRELLVDNIYLLKLEGIELEIN